MRACVCVLVYVCVCPCVCFCVCFCMITQKRNQSGNMKLEFIVVHKTSSDDFDIKHCQNKVKVKVTVGLQKVPHLPQYKVSGPITQLWYKLEAYIKHVCSSD